MVEGRLSPFLLLSLLCFTLYMSSHAFKRSGNLRIRRIPGLDAIDEMVGRVTEMGRPLAFVLGGTELEAQGFASMRILDHVASLAAKYDIRFLTVAPLPEMEPMCQEIVKGACAKEGRPDSYNPKNVMFMPGDGSKAGVLGLYQREDIGGAMLFGNYYYESMLYSEAASLKGASQIGGTANYHQLPFFVASCDYTLIGEEIFAAGTYLSKDPGEVGGLTAQEVGKILAALFMITGSVLTTFGSDIVRKALLK